MPRDDAPTNETLLSTWQKATFHPAALFPDPAPAQREPRPLVFALVVGAVTAPIASLVAGLVSGAGAGALVSAFGALIVSPFATIAGVYASAWLIHFWLILVRGNKGKLRDTVAAVCYARAPSVFAAVPVVGFLIAYAWEFVVLCLGVRSAHRTTLGRAIFAVVAGSPVVFSVLFALGLRAFVLEAFKMPSGSMIPSLVIGDHLFVSKLAYGPLIPWTDTRVLSRLPPARGEVMVFKFPENKDQDFIKRAIALPGDKLEAINGRPVIDGWLVPHCKVGRFEYEKHAAEMFVEFLGEQSYLTLFDVDPDEQTCAGGEDCGAGLACRSGICGVLQGPFQVRSEEVWVMGDNRNNSHDSRSWRGGLGAGVPFENIKGRASFVWMSFGPGGGIAQDRLWLSVHGAPRVTGGNAALRAVDKCLRERPGVAATTPPRGGGK